MMSGSPSRPWMDLLQIPCEHGGNFCMQTFGFNIDDSFISGLGDAFDADNIEFLYSEAEWQAA